MLSQRLAWEQNQEFPPHLFGHTGLFLAWCSSVCSWWPAGWFGWGLLCGKLYARSGSAVPATKPAALCFGTCSAAEAALMGQGIIREIHAKKFIGEIHACPRQNFPVVWVLAPVCHWNNSAKNKAKTFTGYYGLRHGHCAQTLLKKSSLVHSIYFINMKKVKKRLKVGFNEIQKN